MKKTERTPGPWAQSDSNPHLVFKDSQGVIDFRKPIAHFLQNKEGRANAEFTVHACNSHDELLAALEEIVHGAIRINRQDSRITNYSLNLARAAITKAGGKT